MLARLVGVVFIIYANNLRQPHNTRIKGIQSYVYNSVKFSDLHKLQTYGIS